MTYANAFDGSVIVRLTARLFAWYYDQQLINGVSVEPGSPLAMHIVRLTSDRHRRALAATLRRVLKEADAEPVFFASRIPMHRSSIISAVDLINEVRQRLEGPRPVRAHGVARLRMLLADGIGPFYSERRDDLTIALRSVLADL